MSDYNEPGEPTHEPLDMDLVWDLGECIDEVCPDGKLTQTKLAEIARSQSVPLSHVYAAAAFDPEYEWEQTSDRIITVCLGACQGWGACEIADSLLRMMESSADGQAPRYTVQAVGCLDRCMSPVAVDVACGDEVVRHALIRPGAEGQLVDLD